MLNFFSPLGLTLYIVLNVLQERDLSPVTDKLWKKFYEAEFGAKSVEVVVERVKKFKVTFNWRQLYQVFNTCDVLLSCRCLLSITCYDVYILPLLEKA